MSQEFVGLHFVGEHLKFLKLQESVLSHKVSLVFFRVNSWTTTPADKAILAATDECLAGKSISDAAWAEVVKHITDPGQQVEFIIAMGNWIMFSMLFRNLHIPLAEGVTIWPPDGLAAPATQG